MAGPVFLALFFVVWQGTGLPLPSTDYSLPLNRWPMLRAHDAGTGYLQAPDVEHAVIYAWTKTQGGNITTQLQCGARNFDWRPKLQGGTLVFHHGAVTVPHSMEAAAAEVVAWANAASKSGAAPEESLVVLDMWDCEGSGCNEAAMAAFQKVGIPVLDAAAGCTNLTLGDALRLGALPGGGHALATVDCPSAPWTTYDDRLSCTGFLNTTLGRQVEAEVEKCINYSPDLKLAGVAPHRSVWYNKGMVELDWTRVLACVQTIEGILDVGAHFACYPSSPHAEVPWQRLKAFDDELGGRAPPGNPALTYSLQGAWAEHINSIVLGFLHGSSLLADEERSQLNRALVDWVAHFPTYPATLGVNAVCDGGVELSVAMRARVVGASRQAVPPAHQP